VAPDHLATDADDARLAAVDVPTHGAVVPARDVLRHQDADASADDLVRLVAEQPLGGAVEGLDPGRLVDRHDGVHGRLDHGTPALVPEHRARAAVGRGDTGVARRGGHDSGRLVRARVRRGMATRPRQAAAARAASLGGSHVGSAAPASVVLRTAVPPFYVRRRPAPSGPSARLAVAGSVVLEDVDGAAVVREVEEHVAAAGRAVGRVGVEAAVAARVAVPGGGSGTPR
jgi:hypothetical protein